MIVLDVGVSVISRSRTIKAKPRAVWDVLADFGALSSWVEDVDHSCILEHGRDLAPLGTSRRVQIGRTVVVERITDFGAPVTLAYDIEGLPKRLGRVANRWTVRPAAEATMVTITSTVEIGTRRLAAAIPERVICRLMTRQSDTMLAGLAHRLESGNA